MLKIKRLLEQSIYISPILTPVFFYCAKMKKNGTLQKSETVFIIFFKVRILAA